MDNAADPNSVAATPAPSGPDVSRRSIVASAWAVPIIALAVAAPTAAASGGGTAAEIKVLNPSGPIQSENGLAIIVLTVVDAAGAGVGGLVTASLAAAGVGRFDVGIDDSAVSETLAQTAADSSGYVTFSVVRVAAGAVAVVVTSGSVSVSVTVQFD